MVFLDSNHYFLRLSRSSKHTHQLNNISTDMDYVSSYVSVLISNYIISNKENKEIKESNSS